MANTISLSTSVGLNDTATIVDETTFTSPVRGDVGVYVQVFKVNTSGTQTELAVTSNNDDPGTDSEWTFDISQDGHYQAYYASIPNYSALTAYVQYDAVRDVSTDEVYRALQASTGQPLTDINYWEVIDEPATLAENIDTVTESANIDAVVYNDIILNKVNTLYGDKVIAEAKECDCDCSECDDAKKMAQFVRAQREGALIAEIRQSYAEAERCIRRLDELIED